MHSIYVFYLWRSENSLQGVSSLHQPHGSQGWTQLSSKDLYPPTEPSHWPISITICHKNAERCSRNHWAQPGGWQHPENFWKNKAVCGVNREKWLQIASTNFGNDNNYISNLKRKQLFSERGGGEGDWEVRREPKGGWRWKEEITSKQRTKSSQMRVKWGVLQTEKKKGFSFLGRWDGANWWENTLVMRWGTVWRNSSFHFLHELQSWKWGQDGRKSNWWHLSHRPHFRGLGKKACLS